MFNISQSISFDNQWTFEGTANQSKSKKLRSVNSFLAFIHKYGCFVFICNQQSCDGNLHLKREMMNEHNINQIWKSSENEQYEIMLNLNSHLGLNKSFISLSVQWIDANVWMFHVPLKIVFAPFSRWWFFVWHSSATRAPFVSSFTIWWQCYHCLSFRLLRSKRWTHGEEISWHDCAWNLNVWLRMLNGCCAFVFASFVKCVECKQEVTREQKIKRFSMPMPNLNALIPKFYVIIVNSLIDVNLICIATYANKRTKHVWNERLCIRYTIQSQQCIK